jgi:16S rRNA (adenine1518-N6/adenine1519-N6)-dimethyltransferase
LRERFADCPRLTLVEADAVKYLRAEPRDWRGWKLVANLPYSVASTILIDMALNVNGPARQVVTLQFEVARRLVAHAGEPDYGVLTLLVQVAYQPGAWFRIPASCFHPPPKVDSAGVDLCRRAAPLLSPAATDLFSALVKRAFSQRRKMMLKLLQTQWPQARWEQAFARLGLSAQARAETVTLEQFAELTRWLCP